ncbi:hypothetical protein [Faecalibacter bovis]|uniref:Lipoprotein n=1 Tax=Faecalibacter bovis TaxID=2898187 RepID=A0ABX7XEV9_9FLAO|nr:hypothetical protein [Faecalibacter bovis]QTV06347.1 hypothetical protein J9309_03155 [Faecalibacter bovis]
MKYFYSFIILIFFLGCEKNKTSWPANAEIPEEIKDEKFYKTLQQVIDITEKNNIEVYNINVTFTENQIYFFTSEIIEDCMYGDYYQLPIKINHKDYALILTNNKFLNNHIDFKDLMYVPELQHITMICYYFDGLAFAYRKNEIGEYQLIKVLHYDFLNDDFILGEDQEYFPIMEKPELVEEIQ